MEKKSAYMVSLIFLIIGLSFLVNSQANITGAVVGVSTSPSPQRYFLGAIFILTSFILFILSITGIGEKKKGNNQTEK